MANITPDSDNRLKHLISSNFYGRSSLFYLYATFRQYIFRRNILFRLMKTRAKCLLNFIQHSHKYVNKNLYQQSSKLNYQVSSNIKYHLSHIFWNIIWLAGTHHKKFFTISYIISVFQFTTVKIFSRNTIHDRMILFILL